MKPDIQDCIDTLIETRDLCGDETAALIAWQQENGQLTPQEKYHVAVEVSIAWKRAQREAGVTKPLTKAERAKAYRDIENSRA